MPWCALLTAVKNYNKSPENCKTFFKTETKTKCSRPRPRLSFLSSMRLETKTPVYITVAIHTPTPPKNHQHSSTILELFGLPADRQTNRTLPFIIFSVGNNVPAYLVFVSGSYCDMQHTCRPH